MKNTPVRFAPLLAAALLSSGCASIFLSGHDDLKVVTDPPGAVARVGELSVVTPGVLKVRRNAQPVVVLVEKEGYEDEAVSLRRTRTGAVWTNLAWVSAGFALTVAGSVFCGLSDCEGRQYVPLAVGAAASAGGLAVDLSTNRTLTLERDKVVLVLKPRAAAAARGAP